MSTSENTGKIVIVIAKHKFDTKPYGSFVQWEIYLNVKQNLTNNTEFFVIYEVFKSIWLLFPSCKI